MKHYTKKQPKNGEVILHCGHLDGKCHFTFAPGGLEFSRPDDSQGISNWIVECRECFDKRGGSLHFQINGDAIWKGDAAHIEKSIIPEGAIQTSVEAT